MEYMSDIINGVILVIVALIEYRATKARKQEKEEKEKAERRAAERMKESHLAMSMMDATLELCVATALAVEQKKINGEMTAARKSAINARAEYDDFTRHITARHITRA